MYVHLVRATPPLSPTLSPCSLSLSSLYVRCRAAQPKSSEEQCRAIFEKGERIEQEFAEYFTGKLYCINVVDYNPFYIT